MQATQCSSSGVNQRLPELLFTEATRGYTSEEEFSRAFKRSLGKSPTHWRDSNE